MKEIIYQLIWEDFLRYIQSYLPYIEAILAIIIAVLIARFISKIARRRLHGHVPSHILANISKLIYYVLIIIGLLVAIRSLQIPGLELTEILIAGGFISIVIGLAAQQTLSNFFAGLLILFERPFKIGDFININNNIGMVVDMGLLSTKIHSWEGFYIRIPNSQIFTASVINYSTSIVRLVRVQFTVPFETDIKKVIEALLKKFDEQWYILVEPKPIVFPVNFVENGILMEARAWTSGKTWFDLFSNMPSLIENTLKELGIQYSYPRRILTESKIEGISVHKT